MLAWISFLFLSPTYMLAWALFKPWDLLLFGADGSSSRYAWLRHGKDGNVRLPSLEPFFEVLMKITGIAREVKFVLQDHFNYTPMPSMPWMQKHLCAYCFTPCTHWCVQCASRLCKGCTIRRHHPGTYSEWHSIEKVLGTNEETKIFEPGEMGLAYDDNGFVKKVSAKGQAFTMGIKKGYRVFKVDGEQYSKDVLRRAEHSGLDYRVTFQVNPVKGVPILSPVLAEIFLITSVIYISTHIELTRGYLRQVDMCPVVNFSRDILAAIDSKLVYYLKNSLLQNCGIEDSFYKLFLDAWVRDIATQTDDTLLLITTLPAALLFQTVVRYFVLPFAAFSYASAMYMVVRLEELIPETGPVNYCAERIHSFTKLINAFELFEGRGDTPPLTEPRERPSVDMFEGFSYWRKRWLRGITYYYHQTEADLNTLITGALWKVVIFRLICMWSYTLLDFGPQFLIRWVLQFLGFHPTLERHNRWFEANAQSALNDRFFLKEAKRLSGFGVGVLQRIPINMYFIWWFLHTVPVVVLIYVVYKLVDQRRRSSDMWKTEGRMKCLGCCDKDNCMCISISEIKEHEE